jgi:site-specific DNA recombinase
MSTTGWAIYTRESQDRSGERYAVERQLEDCHERGQELGLPGEPKIYSDNDRPAKRGDYRPDFQKLLTAIGDKQVKILIVWHMDRFMREPTELEALIDMVEYRGLKIHNAAEGGEIDLSTPSGRREARGHVTHAKYEIEHKAQRQTRAIVQKTARGERHGGTRTFGYGRTVDGHSVDIHKLNRKEASAILAAFDAILRGESTTSVWRSWNRKHLTTVAGKPWNGSNFHALITRPTLAGLVVYGGGRDENGKRNKPQVVEGVEASWPAIVSEDKWRAVQAIITDPSRRTSPGNVVSHLCSGLVFCECGRKMRARSNTYKVKSTGERVKFTVLKCITEATKGHSTMVETQLDEEVRDKVVDWLYATKDKPPTLGSDDEAQLALLHKELAVTRDDRATIQSGFKAGIYTELEAAKEIRTIEAEAKRINAEIDKLTRHVAAAGVDEALWEEIWAKASGPVLTPAGKGRQRFHGSRALVQSLMRRRGISEEEAKAKIELYRRFDALSLDQRRALVKQLPRITVLRGIHHDSRVAVGPLTG